ncbi:Hypothetical predicted protein [Octopus vulgaris]|uniref:Uncharacterized protein n=1 Tax=Octopus vulgaris TaxID=6645 RepID=A0AA36ARI3_OCTVU|nr:Hypothetical predicted protein [Octopus vulgaris]
MGIVDSVVVGDGVVIIIVVIDRIIHVVIGAVPDSGDVVVYVFIKNKLKDPCKAAAANSGDTRTENK